MIRQVLKEGVRLAGAGAGLGMLASLLVARWLSQVSPSAASPTPWAWLGAPLVLIVVLAIASVLPARRALRADPLTTLRDF